MNIQIDYSFSIDEFLEMVKSIGWKTYSKKQVEKAKKNTMYMVKTAVDGKLTGIGRVIGDYSIVCILTGICVEPKFQGKGRLCQGKVCNFLKFKKAVSLPF